MTPPPPPPQPPDNSTEVFSLPPESGTEEPDEQGRPGWKARLFSREASSCLTSCVVHAVLLLILGLIAEAVAPGSSAGSLIVSISEPGPLDELEELEWEVDLPAPDRLRREVALPDRQPTVPDPTVVSDEPLPSNDPLGGGFGLDPPGSIQLFPPADAPVGGGLEGRTPQGRARLALEGDGTEASEAAVERGLRWLAAYQRKDGSWNFDHNKGRTSGFCPNPGTVASTTGATAIALAPFLGAGYTHRYGDYQETVRKGLYYLQSRALVTPRGVDLQEGTMYAQGLSAIVLCEAYAMTGDPSLKEVAQQALDFIDYAQNKQDGGWRYTPGEPGDTTVTGWQLMALKSGEMAGLRVRSPTVLQASSFLDRVSCEDGARYGYMNSTPRNTTTAIGLLCRMYTGWRRSEPGLRIGVEYLGEWGPSDDNMYFNYYATQVLRHWGGPEWKKWNPKMRDYLVATQSDHGHASGSWHFSGGHGDTGGRLYNTAMAVMTLEVYYRYMPLYRQKAFEP